MATSLSTRSPWMGVRCASCGGKRACTQSERRDFRRSGSVTRTCRRMESTDCAMSEVIERAGCIRRPDCGAETQSLVEGECPLPIARQLVNAAIEDAQAPVTPRARHHRVCADVDGDLRPLGRVGPRVSGIRQLPDAPRLGSGGRRGMANGRYQTERMIFAEAHRERIQRTEADYCAGRSVVRWIRRSEPFCAAHALHRSRIRDRVTLWASSWHSGRRSSVSVRSSCG